MGRLIVESISAIDFLSYHEEQTVFLGGKGPMAVVGPNGAGKSTLVSKALSWGLYGTCAPERMGASTRAMRGKDVLRRKMEPVHGATPDAKEAKVMVVLRDEDDGTEWQVIRERNKSGSDRLNITCRNDAAGYHEEEEPTQEYIDRLIGAPYDVFVRTCLRGQNDPWNFAEATDAKKREILDSISGALMLDLPHSRAKAVRDTAKRQAAVYNQRQADALRRAAETDPAPVEASAATWDTGLAKRVEDAEAEVATLEARLTAATTADAAQVNAAEQRAALDAQRPTIDMKPYHDAVSEAVSRASAAETAYAIAREGQAQAQRLIAAGKCPECGQPIAKDSPAHQVMAVPLSSDVMAAAQAHRAECQQSRADATGWLSTATAEWQAKMAALPVVGAMQAPAAQAALDAATRRLADIKASENPYTVAVETARKQHFDLSREAALYADRQREADRQVRLAVAWMEVLSPKGVRAHMAEGALAAIEAEANKWLTVLSEGRFAVSFPPTKTTQRTKSVKEEIQTIIRKGTAELPFLAFSGGEKRRINLAVDLGVAATFARGGALALSLLVLDEEVFSGLDEDGKAGVVTALHHAGVADVVVIDHDPRLSGVLPRTVRASLGPDGYSRMVEVTL